MSTFYCCCCRAAAAGFAGRDLHKPPPSPLVPEAGGLCCIFCFLAAATAGQLLLDRRHLQVRVATAAAFAVAVTSSSKSAAAAPASAPSASFGSRRLLVVSQLLLPCRCSLQ